MSPLGFGREVFLQGVAVYLRRKYASRIGLAACLLILLGRPVASISPASVRVDLVAEGTSWKASYAVSRVRPSIPTGREIHVALNADVRLVLSSREYVSSFQLPDLKLRDFAAPGISTELHFRADRPGRYLLRGEELCGRPHDERALGWLIVEDAASFQEWIRGL